MRHLLYILLVAVLFSTGCKSKRYVNKAMKLENSGLYTDAANMYFYSLEANRNNIDAKIGLQRTGQMVLEDKIEEFTEQYNNGSTKAAVYTFRDAENYYKKLSVLGVRLELSEDQRAYYDEVEDLYLNKLYQEAVKALELEEFKSAEPVFREILSLDANYKDTKTKWIIAKYEPIYRMGTDNLTNNMFRKAYYNFDAIIDGTGGYKNSLELKNEALRNAMITIAIVPFSYQGSRQRDFASKLGTKLVSSINNLKSPFYKVISDRVIQSAPIANYKGDPTKYIQWLKSTGAEVEAKAILTGGVIKIYSKTGSLQRTEKHGYTKRTIEVLNKITNEKEKKTVYDKVIYYEYKKRNLVQISLNYALTRMDNGEIVVSDIFTSEKTDEIHYAGFNGDYKSLVPGYWKKIDKESDSDKVYDDRSSINHLRTLFNNEKKISSTYEIEAHILNQASTSIADHISNYNPEQ